MAILDVIKCESSNKTLVEKFPHEDFNTMSQLIVHESQEALLFKDGQALDLFGPGRYKMDTQNIPLLNKLINLPFGGVSPFHCEVYFINKTEEMAIRWGTDARVQYTDPALGYQLTIGASGEMTLAVEDSRKLVLKLVGTEAALGQAKFLSYMRSLINQKVKPYLARIMATGEFSIFDVDAHMEEFANELHAMLRPDFADYGIDLRRFMLTTIAKPEDDPNYQYELSLNAQQRQRIRQAEIDLNEQRIRQVGQANINAEQTVIDANAAATATVLDAEAMAEKRRREGYTYQQERGFDVSERMAANQAVGEFTNIGIGMGMISGVGANLSGSVAQMANDALSSVGGVGQVAQPQTQAQPQPQSAAAAPADAAAAAEPLADMKIRIEKLKLMKESGLLSDEEFEQQRLRLISEI